MKTPKPTWSSEDGAMALYRGDARELVPRLSDKSVDMIFTDPPYGHKNNDGDLIARREKIWKDCEPSAKRPIANDGPEANDLVRFLFEQSARVLRCCCCCCCCCGGGGPDPQFARWSLWMGEQLTFKQMVVWDKGPMGMGFHYRRSYEVVLVGHRGQKCRWYDETRRVENVIRPAERIRKIIPTAAEHPTAKPPELAARFLRCHTLPGDLVLDPFMGAGSTAIACIREGRRFVGIECDPTFFRDTVACVKAELRTQRRSQRLAALAA